MAILRFPNCKYCSAYPAEPARITIEEHDGEWVVFSTDEMPGVVGRVSSMLGQFSTQREAKAYVVRGGERRIARG
jgi:hypothetical protein